MPIQDLLRQSGILQFLLCLRKLCLKLTVKPLDLSLPRLNPRDLIGNIQALPRLFPAFSPALSTSSRISSSAFSNRSSGFTLAGLVVCLWLAAVFFSAAKATTA
jgi:hypothetical protein